jgi:hypothetical protein
VNATLERVRARVAERFPADLDRIRDYLRLPSVSATGEGIRATAGAHGPDEYATVAGLQEHVVGAAAFLLALAAGAVEAPA